MKQVDDKTMLELIGVLNSFLYDSHCETNILDGGHTRGFCKTCADHYFAGQNVLAKLMELIK